MTPPVPAMQNDWGVFVTWERDTYGWGPDNPMGCFTCTFQEVCHEWAHGRSMLQYIPSLGFPTEIVVARGLNQEGKKRDLARLSFRDIRSAARGVLSEEDAFKTKAIDYDTFYDALRKKHAASK